MDFWASIEHKMKYKPDKEVTKSTSKELVQCAKIVNKLDNKMMILNTWNNLYINYKVAVL